MAKTGNTSDDNNLEVDPLSGETIPPTLGADARLNELLGEIVDDSPLEKRRSLLVEMEEKKNKVERIEFLGRIIQQKTLEEVKTASEAFREDTETISDGQVEALTLLRGTLPFLITYFTLKSGKKVDLSSLSSIQSLSEIKGLTALDKEYISLLTFLHSVKQSNEDSAIAEFFFEKILPTVTKESEYFNEVTQAALDDLDGKEENYFSKLRGEHPKAYYSLLTLGAVGGGLVVAHLVKSIRDKFFKDNNNEPEVQKTEDKKGIIGKISSTFSGLTGKLFGGLLAVTGVMGAGAILGREDVRKRIEKAFKGGYLEDLYGNRLFAAYLQFSRLNGVEALATLNYGAKSENDLIKYKRYASYFGIKIDEFWATSGVRFKDFLNAPLGRNYPLVVGTFGSIPIIGKMFESDEQVAAEVAMQKKLKENPSILKDIYEKIPDADEKSIAEVFDLAFFTYHLFDVRDSEQAKHYSHDLNDKISDEELQITDFKSSLDEFRGVSSFSFEDKEKLNERKEFVRADLEKLQLALPNYYDTLREKAILAFPAFAVEDFMFEDDDIDHSDLVNARAFYNETFDKALDNDIDGIGEDMLRLDHINDFIVSLDEDKDGKLTSDEQLLLDEYLIEMEGIYENVHKSLIRALVDRRVEYEHDVNDDNLWEDTKEFGGFYWTAYTGAVNIITWSYKTLRDEKSSNKSKYVALGSSVFAAAAIADLVRGAKGIGSGFVAKGMGGYISMLKGGSRILVPGVQASYDSIAFVKNAMQQLVNSPKSILEKVLNGEMSVKRAKTLARIGIRHEDMIASMVKSGDTGQVLGEKLGLIERMKSMKTLLKLFDELDIEILENAIKDPKEFKSSYLVTYYKDMKNVLKVNDDQLFIFLRQTWARRKMPIINDLLTNPKSGYTRLKWVKELKEIAVNQGENFDDYLRELLAMGEAGVITNRSYIVRKSIQAVEKVSENAVFRNVKAFCTTMSQRMGRTAISSDAWKAMEPHIMPFVKSMTFNKAFAQLTVFMTVWEIVDAAYANEDKSRKIIDRARSAAVWYGAASAGFKVGKATPGHAVIKFATGIAATVGIGFLGDELTEKYLQDPIVHEREGVLGAANLGVHGIAAPMLLYIYGLGPWGNLLDHYFGDNDERDYFMREMYSVNNPLTFWKPSQSYRIAFHETSYTEEVSAERAVQLWNMKMQEEIDELEEDSWEEDEAEDGTVTKIRDNSNDEEIEMKSLQIIDDDWIEREAMKYSILRAGIDFSGKALFEGIDQKLTKQGVWNSDRGLVTSDATRERTAVKSLLVTDSAESWYEEDFFDIEKTKGVATARKYCELLDDTSTTRNWSDELDNFIRTKRLLHSEIKFYETIGLYDEIRSSSEDSSSMNEDNILRGIGFQEKTIGFGHEVFDDIFGEDFDVGDAAIEVAAKAA